MEGGSRGHWGGQRPEELRGRAEGAWEDRYLQTEALQHLAACNVLVRGTAAYSSRGISMSTHR